MESNELRKELKEHGYSNRKVSVTCSYGGYSERIDVTIKDLSIPIKEIKEIANKYKSISDCEVTHEILEGGNTYIFVKYDYDTLSNAIKKKIPEAEKILQDLKSKQENRGEIFFETEKQKIYITKRSGNMLASIHFFEIKDKTYRSIKDINCYSIQDLAKFLVMYDCQIKEGGFSNE
jgi:hypothetical protein